MDKLLYTNHEEVHKSEVDSPNASETLLEKAIYVYRSNTCYLKCVSLTEKDFLRLVNFKLMTEKLSCLQI